VGHVPSHEAAHARDRPLLIEARTEGRIRTRAHPAAHDRSEAILLPQVLSSIRQQRPVPARVARPGANLARARTPAEDPVDLVRLNVALHLASSFPRRRGWADGSGWRWHLARLQVAEAVAGPGPSRLSGCPQREAGAVDVKERALGCDGKRRSVRSLNDHAVVPNQSSR
jgi:hypothetical protein